MYKGEVVCGASSYSIYDNGIEIEVATDHNYRRKGLATIVSAALILDCLEKGIYPNWDAANTTSAKLAEKLGYVFDKAYDTYFVDNSSIKEQLAKANSSPKGNGEIQSCYLHY